MNWPAVWQYTRKNIVPLAVTLILGASAGACGQKYLGAKAEPAPVAAAPCEAKLSKQDMVDILREVRKLPPPRLTVTNEITPKR